MSNRELLTEADFPEGGAVLGRRPDDSDVAELFRVVEVGQGWAVRCLPSGGFLEWEDGSPRLCATRQAALHMAAGTYRYTMIAGNGLGLAENG
jgi:hypothetical protein